MRQCGSALILALAALAATAAWANQGVVLGLRPDGVVIDVAALPGIQPGARVGFLRPDPQRTPTGQGFVLDVQAGQALVGVVPGTAVQVNDLVVLCPSRGSSETDQVRALVDGIRGQVASPQVQATASRLQSVLDARDVAIQQGSCDLVQFDQEIQGLLAQLQGDAAAQAPPQSAPPYPWPSATAPGPSLAGGSPPTVGAGTTSPPPAGDTSFPAPAGSVGAPAGDGTGGTAAGTPGQSGDAIDTVARSADVLAKLALIAQTLGLTPGGVGAGGAQPGAIGAGSSAPVGGGFPPAEGAQPPAVGGAPSTGSTPPPTGGSALFPGSGSPQGTPPPAGGGSVPPSGAGSAPGSGAPAGTGSAPPTGASTGTVVGARPILRATPFPSPTTRAQVAVIPKTTVTGRIQTQSGQPVAAAQILIGDAKGQSDAQGQFTVPGLPPGQYTVMVTAPGYLKQTRTIKLDPGETERLVFVMPRMLPFRPAPRTP